MDAQGAGQVGRNESPCSSVVGAIGPLHLERDGAIRRIFRSPTLGSHEEWTQSSD